MNDLSVGEVLRLRNVTHYNPLKKGEKGLISVGYTAPKNTVFLCVLLGVEPKDGSQTLDLEAAMNRLGWFRKE
jgi:hypothetical protein